MIDSRQAENRRAIRASGVALAIALAMALIAVACSSGEVDDQTSEPAVVVATESESTTAVAPTPTIASEPTTSPTEPPTTAPAPTGEPTPIPESTSPPTPAPNLLDEAFVSGVAAEVELSDGVFLFVALKARNQPIAGTSGTDAYGNGPTSSDPFRIGSLTKMFTAVAVLTLVDEGLVDLDAPAAAYVTRVAVPDGVTVRDLLRHTSGLFNYTDAPTFFRDAFARPDRIWTPEEVLQPVLARDLLFEPGARFSYSNSNYLTLGLLVEEVTGQPYHEVVRERITTALGLSSNTYVGGFEDGPEPFDPYEHLGQADFDYTSIATGAWSAGSVVSTPTDVHTMLTALFDGQLVSADLVEEMIAGSDYGLGMQLADSDRGLYGHDGAIPGYLTMVRHSPELGVTAFLVTTDPSARPRGAVEAMLDGFDGLSASAG